MSSSTQGIVEDENKILNAFIEDLLKHGYPREYIAIGWGRKGYATDVAVLYKDCVNPIAIYEIKVKKTKLSITNGLNHLRKVRSELGLAIQYCLIFESDEAPYFEVVDVSKIINNDEKEDITKILVNKSQPSEPISYEKLSAGMTGKIALEKEEKKQKKIGRFRIACLAFVPIIILVIVLDALCIYVLNVERLVILAMLIGIVLLPFFSVIKWGDISLERKNGKEIVEDDEYL